MIRRKKIQTTQVFLGPRSPHPNPSSHPDPHPPLSFSPLQQKNKEYSCLCSVHKHSHPARGRSLPPPPVDGHNNKHNKESTHNAGSNSVGIPGPRHDDDTPTLGAWLATGEHGSRGSHTPRVPAEPRSLFCASVTTQTRQGACAAHVADKGGHRRGGGGGTARRARRALGLNGQRDLTPRRRGAEDAPLPTPQQTEG